MKKFRAVLAVMVVLLTVLSIPASAHGTGKSYVYDHNMETMEIPDPYAVVDTIGNDLNLVDPVDMVILDEMIFILDGGKVGMPGSAKIYVLDKNYQPVIEHAGLPTLGSAWFANADGSLNYEMGMLDGTIELKTIENGLQTATSFQEASGFWVTNTGTKEEPDYTFYVVDTMGHAVFIFEETGSARMIDGKVAKFGKPDTPLMQDVTEMGYLPTDVITDHLGTIYVRVKNEYRGFVMLEPDGTFLGFFGSNEVVRSAEVIFLKMLKPFLTDEQLERIQQVLPMEYANFCIDKEGDFIYGVRGATEDMMELIRKINCKGNNVLDYVETFGDANMVMRSDGTQTKTNFNAITVDENNFITAFDSTAQRMFQYTPEGELMYVFGGQGTQQGTFRGGVDIESWGDRLYILDSDFNTITVLEPTAFGRNVRLGQTLYGEGKYEEALKPFQDVVTECMNYEFGYAGIGKAQYMQRDYKAAMDSFYLAHDQDNYSMAFKMYRGIAIREMIVPAVIVIAVVVVLLIVLKVLKSKGIIKKRETALDEGGKGKYVLHTIFHPIESYEEMRYNQKHSLLIGNIAIFFFFFSTVIKSLYSGFIFNGTNAATYNMLFTIVGILGGFTLFTIVNWLMSSFFEGKGKFKDVWIYLGYATIPYSVTAFAYTLLSNILTAEEATFLTYLNIVGIGWSLVMALFALQGVHMYSFKRNLASILVTILGMLVVIFIVFLMFNLFIQFFSFMESIITELMYRSAVGF